MVIASAAVLIFGLLVMALWNAILPGILGVKTITFLQALGILLLCKILFGGFGPKGRFGGRCSGNNERWKMKMKDRFANMTPDEKEKIKSKWQKRCGNKWDINDRENEINMDEESER